MAKKKTKKATNETFEFQAETRQLLDIVIHSLYSHKEIFLRELISNASDALDRLRFEALTTPNLLTKDETLEIRIEVDSEARTLTLSDNGVGMSRDEVVANIGTIAKSGTREMVAKAKESESSDALAELIGQFGVGFYSSFMVSKKVTLVTRRSNEEKATRWESAGDGEYTLTEDHRFLRGTTITLHLLDVDKDDGIEDFTSFGTVERVVKKYSDFVAYPVMMKQEREESENDEEGKPIEGKTQTVVEDKTLNSMRPIWTRPADEVKAEEYNEFYRHISHDWNEPHKPLALKAEGRIEYQALLFFPTKAPMDLFYREHKWGLQLYVRRVLIMDNCENLLPPYLRFIKGVVDSSDLPLNVSREMIHQDRHIQLMKKWMTKKVLDHLTDWKKNNEEEYLGFFGELGRVLKEGVSFENENRDKITPLLYFHSSHSDDKLTSLDGYIERMKDDQDEIYYLTGESMSVVKSSPHLEAFLDKGYEVLYLVDQVDEFLAQSLTDYEERKLKSVGKGEVKLGSEEEKKKAEEELKEKEESHKDLLETLKKNLEDSVKEVRLSSRLTTSPVCLVGSEFDMSPHMERLLRQSDGAGMPKQQRILELNPEHDILKKLQERFDADKEDAAINDYAHLLYGYALLAEGSDLPDPALYNRLVGELMMKSL
jgi:molecular chaperone HtpG